MQAKALLTDDFGKDLASVEALIRRHDELERDLTAIESKLEVRTGYNILCTLYCQMIILQIFRAKLMSYTPLVQCM